MAGLLLSENPRISRAELIAELKERCFTPEPTTATPPTAKESLESAHVIGTLLGMGRDTGPRDDSFLMSIHPAGSHRAQPAQGQDLSLSYSLPGYEQFFSDARPF